MLSSAPAPPGPVPSSAPASPTASVAEQHEEIEDESDGSESNFVPNSDSESAEDSGSSESAVDGVHDATDQVQVQTSMQLRARPSGKLVYREVCSEDDEDNPVSVPASCHASAPAPAPASDPVTNPARHSNAAQGVPAAPASDPASPDSGPAPVSNLASPDPGPDLASSDPAPAPNRDAGPAPASDPLPNPAHQSDAVQVPVDQKSAADAKWTYTADELRTKDNVGKLMLYLVHQPGDEDANALTFLNLCVIKSVFGWEENQNGAPHYWLQVRDYKFCTQDQSWPLTLKDGAFHDFEDYDVWFDLSSENNLVLGLFKAKKTSKVRDKKAPKLPSDVKKRAGKILEASVDREYVRDFLSRSDETRPKSRATAKQHA